MYIIYIYYNNLSNIYNICCYIVVIYIYIYYNISGDYLTQEIKHWSDSYNIQALAVQLIKANMDKVECIELTEQLLEIAQRYINKSK